jgi:hypothetical protein
MCIILYSYIFIIIINLLYEIYSAKLLENFIIQKTQKIQKIHKPDSLNLK